MHKIFELSKISVFFVLLIVLLVYGCDSDGGNSQNCSLEEIREQFANTECIADEMVNGCPNLVCESIEPNSILIGRFRDNCSEIDCETLECELLVGGDQLVLGMLSELVIDEISGLPTGFVVIGEDQAPFECLIAVP